MHSFHGACTRYNTTRKTNVDPVGRAPIDQLPDDLVLGIALMSVEQTTLASARAVLPLVCKRWHSLLHANGQLWSTLDFPNVLSLAHGCGLLASSKTAPLSLTRVGRLASFRGDASRQAAFLARLRAQQHRYFRLELVSWVTGRRVIERSEPFPVLSELEFTFPLDRKDTDLVEFLQKAEMPALRRVRLRRTAVQYLHCAPALFNQVTRLTLAVHLGSPLSLAGLAVALLPLEHLETLRIELQSLFNADGLTTYDLPPDAADDVRIVHPRLRDLVIEGGSAHPLPHTGTRAGTLGFRSTPWELPTLRTIVLPHHIVRACLVHLSAPGVETLICEHLDWGMDLLALISSAFPSLHTLYLTTQLPLNLTPLHTTLTHLRCLVLKGNTPWNDNTTAILDSLAQPDAAGVWTCPRLETLDLGAGADHGSTHAARYVRLVQVRATGARAGLAVGPLRCVAVSKRAWRLRVALGPFVRDRCESVTKASLVPADVRL